MAAVAAAVVVATVASLGAPTASAAQDDGQIQPGDRFGINYCSVGPTYAQFVFTPKHCGWLGALGDAATVNGAESSSDDAQPGADWRYSLLSRVPSSISTWSDCPSIRRTEADPITPESCRRSEADQPFVGVLQPWRGLTISKSGATTGTTAGTAMNSPGATNDRGADGRFFVQDMYVCKGDSGSVAFAELDGEVYLVGMVTGGNGSLGVDQPIDTYGKNDKACYRSLDDDNYSEIIGIGHLCRQLPDPDRTACSNEAGMPRGEVVVDHRGGNGVAISAVGFDPDSAGQGPLQRIDVTVDGQPILFYRTVSDQATRFGLNAEGRWGVRATTDGLGDGVHEVCVVFHNEPDTPGADVRDCFPVSVCHARPADHTVIGTSGADRFVATTGRDLIIGGGGDDQILGLDSADCYFPGTAAQLLQASAPDGFVDGIDPNDRCTNTTAATSAGSSTLVEALLGLLRSLTVAATVRGRTCQ